MKNWFSGLIVVLLLLFAFEAQAQQWRLLTQAERATHGATHVWTVEASDLVTANTNTAETVDVQLIANTLAEFVKMQLVTPFSAALTNDSLTVAVGDEDSATRFLAATQLAADDTQVYWAFPSQTLVYLGPDVGTTNTVAVSVAGRHVFTDAKKLRLTFTPRSTQSTGSFDTGEVRFYFNVWDRR